MVIFEVNLGFWLLPLLASSTRSEKNIGVNKLSVPVFFTVRRSYASAVLGIVILSVRLSHACFVTNPKNLPAIFLYHMKGQSF